MHYRGGCHCGNVQIEVEGELEAVLSCNCSICSKKGVLLWAVPHNRLTITANTQPASYTFNTHKIIHRFCSQCGIHPYAEDATEGVRRTAYINVRCLEAVNLPGLQHIEFDGRSM